jgi:hypothetical protein
MEWLQWLHICPHVAAGRDMHMSVSSNQLLGGYPACTYDGNGTINMSVRLLYHLQGETGEMLLDNPKNK